eukprot:1936226-Rhodomonas_salina.1
MKYTPRTLQSGQRQGLFALDFAVARRTGLANHRNVRCSSTAHREDFAVGIPWGKRWAGRKDGEDAACLRLASDPRSS